MTSQTTGNSGLADGHQQSIGAETDQPVDGIAGSNPGTQQPSGADVDAGGAGAGPGQRHDEPAPVKEKKDSMARGAPASGLSGMSGQGIGRPGGATGVLGSHAQARVARLDRQADPMYAGNWTGSITRGGKSVGVSPGSGSISRQHSSGK